MVKIEVHTTYDVVAFRMEKQRIEFLDLAKGFCIFLVVIFHMSICYHVDFPAADFFKACRLPLYFFLSGLFFKTYSGFFNFFKRKTNKLLIPFAFWYLLFSVLEPYLEWRFLHIPNVSDYSIKDSLLNFYYKETFPNAPLWFLLCLFEVNILFYVLQLLSNRFFKGDIVSVGLMSLLCGVIGISMSFLKINLPMYIDSAFSSLPFFAFGYVAKQTNLLGDNKWDKYIAFIIIGLFALVFLFARHYSLKFNRYFFLSNAISVYPCGFMGTMGVVLLAKKIKRLPLVTTWGRYSIMILVTHLLVLRIYTIILGKFGIHGNWGCLVNIILTFASYSLLIPLMKRYLPHVTAQKDVIKV